MQENLDVWFVRPLPPSLLKVLALETVYLLPLRLMFLDEMMSDLTTLVDGYLNAYREGSSVQLGNTEVSMLSLKSQAGWFLNPQIQGCQTHLVPPDQT